MATYAIGDVQGCHDALQQLLTRVRFDPAADRLWFVGDLVNRGPDSPGVLRLVKSLGGSAITVLGNHDLHLLAVAEGATHRHHSDTLDDVLNAPDRDELLDWLRRRPLLHTENEYVLVHAGLLPAWSAQKARQLAEETEVALRGDGYITLLAHMYGNTPTGWNDSLTGYKRLRVVINAFTRMRVCTPQGDMEFKFKGEVQDIPRGYLPWFDAPNRASAESTVVCGHWSALGLKLEPNLIAVDTGYLWGGALTAVRLEDRQMFQVRAA
ncbi:MAG: symmetrical bis(5'-nucleosyl)-tetraphosphatase [Gallionellaceae bacterium]|nr:symmetrical bis(5'-nucleosyl)-tetraphosphatase [Gallionellaceae bacterium]